MLFDNVDSAEGCCCENWSLKKCDTRGVIVNDSTTCNWMPAKMRKNPVAIVAVRLIEISKNDGRAWLLLHTKLENQRLLERN